MVEELDAKLKDFVSYQKMTYQTMEEVRKLFADISVQKDNSNIYLSTGKLSQNAAQKESVEEVRRLLEEQGERQEALLEEMNKNMKSISKTRKADLVYLNKKRRELCAEERNQMTADLMSGDLILI